MTIIHFPYVCQFAMNKKPEYYDRNISRKGMNMISQTNITCAEPCRQPHPVGLIRSFWAWHGLARQRRDLARLDARRLRDIGLSPEEANSESTRPFWDAPRHWKA